MSNTESDSKNISRKAFSERLRQLRSLRGMTMKEMAQGLNISVATYREWEHGRSIQDSSMYPRIAEILNTSLKELMIGPSANTSEIIIKFEKIEQDFRQIKEILKQLLED